MVSTFALGSAIAVGAVFVLTQGVVAGTDTASSYPSWLIISYVAGLSMIMLPCTLPLVFVIVPLSMGKGARRGPLMALLFGTGLILTITAYGAIIGVLGGGAGLNDITQYMFGIAGAAAFVFGLSQLGLVRLKLPTYSGTPQIIQNRGDYAKALGMGLLLGNAGVGCPNPMFYWLLIYIAGTGSAEIGSSLGAVHGLGRAIPLILFSVLAVLGINATSGIVANRRRIEAATGWMLIIIGSFLIINALPGGHQWYESTIIHIWWNGIISVLSMPPEFQISPHIHDASTLVIPPIIVPGMLTVMILAPVGWFFMRRAYQ